MERPIVWMSRRTSAGFTLTELVVGVGVLAMLIALLLPVVSRTREAARRATDLSNLRQLAVATICYAQANDRMFPPGRIASAAAGADDYTWLNYATCWEPLESLAPSLDTMISCTSVREGYAGAARFGDPARRLGRPTDTRVGWTYWAGRDDLGWGAGLKYRSIRRLGERLTPGSQTLWTCMCWDSAGQGGASVCPHVGSRYMAYPPGAPLAPPPDGLGVALTDGSASFVAWNDLVTIPQANGFKLYYQP